MKIKEYKCPICKRIYKDKSNLYNHIDLKHKEALPEGFSPARYYFMTRNKGKKSGSCRICGAETEFDEVLERYQVFCSTKCKDIYAKQCKERMVKKYGKEHLLDDPKYQSDKMLSNRRQAGNYKWSDGNYISYFGEYEKDFLQFEDLFLKMNSKSIIMPSNIIIEYEFNGNKHSYIPDQYIPEINLLVEIKYGDDNTHHYAEKEKAKNNAKWNHIKNNTDYNFIVIRNKEYAKFLELLTTLKEEKYENRHVLIESVVSECQDIILHEAYNDIMEKDELEQSKVTYYPVYLVFTANNTLVGKGIRMATNCEYNHVSLSFNNDLSYMMSFTPNIGSSSFTIEDIRGPIFNSILKKFFVKVVLLTKEQYKTLKDYILNIYELKENYSYRYARFLEFLFKIKKRDDKGNSYVCSEFIDMAMKSIGLDISEKDTYEVKPSDLYNYSGHMSFNLFNKGLPRDKVKNFNTKKYLNNLAKNLGINIKYPKNKFIIESLPLAESFDISNIEIKPVKNNKLFILYYKLINDIDYSMGISIDNNFNNVLVLNKDTLKFESIDLNDISTVNNFITVSIYSKNMSDSEMRRLIDNKYITILNSIKSLKEPLRISGLFDKLDIPYNELKDYNNKADAISKLTDQFEFKCDRTNNQFIFNNKLKKQIDSDLYVNINKYSTFISSEDNFDAYNIMCRENVQYMENIFAVNIDNVINNIYKYTKLYYSNLSKFEYKDMNIKIHNWNDEDKFIIEFNRFNNITSLIIHEKIHDNIFRIYGIYVLCKNDNNDIIAVSNFNMNRYTNIEIIPIELLIDQGKFITDYNNSRESILNNTGEGLTDILNTIIHSESYDECDLSMYLYEGNYNRLSKEERDELPLDRFGLPDKRKYPMHDIQHLMSAKRYFYKCDEEDKEELANNIYRINEEFGLPATENSGQWYKYVTIEKTNNIQLGKNVAENHSENLNINTEEHSKSSDYQMLLEEFLLEKEIIPISIDESGKLIIKNNINNNFGDRYQQSHKLLMIYEENKNIEGIKAELLKLWYMNNIIENYILHPKSSVKGKIIYNLKKSEREHLVNVRSHILSDFKKYLKIVLEDDKDFNFSEYYENSPYNEDEYYLTQDNIKALQVIISTIIKLI